MAGPADDVAHEVHHALLVPRPREHGAHRGDRARATVAHHQPDAPEAALDHASDELLPAGGILLHALGHSDDLAVAFGVHPDGDEHAHVLHRAAPRAPVPHAVHEHVGVFAFQRPRAPRVDVGVHPLEFVGEGLRGHPLAPQQLADVVDLAGGDARQVHVDQGLLDAFPAPAVAFDHRRFEQGALQFGHLQLERAGLGGDPAFVMVGAVRLPAAGTLVSGRPGDLVGLRVEHRVEYLGDLLRDEPVEPGLEHVLVDLYDVLGHGSASWFPISVFSFGE